jgi:hypothetical protein
MVKMKEPQPQTKKPAAAPRPIPTTPIKTKDVKIKDVPVDFIFARYECGSVLLLP